MLIVTNFLFDLTYLLYIFCSHNILIFPGLGPTVGKALRIGLMGVSSTTEVADAVVDAMADTLRVLKRSSLWYIKFTYVLYKNDFIKH